MKLIFLGVGEAFDENIPNTSVLVVSDRKVKVIFPNPFEEHIL